MRGKVLGDEPESGQSFKMFAVVRNQRQSVAYGASRYPKIVSGNDTISPCAVLASFFNLA